MVSLLPAVHCLLVVLPRLEEHHVDGAGVGSILELVELLADSVADVGGGDAERVEGADFGGLQSIEFGYCVVLVVVIVKGEGKEWTGKTVEPVQPSTQSE